MTTSQKSLILFLHTPSCFVYSYHLFMHACFSVCLCLPSDGSLLLFSFGRLLVPSPSRPSPRQPDSREPVCSWDGEPDSEESDQYLGLRI